MAAKGQTLAEFEPLFPAEKKLIAACRDGELAVISATRPEKLTLNNHVRAEFVRFLARGGDEDAPVHEQGVYLHGGVVVGELDLAWVRVPHPLRLHDCRFQTSDGQLADLIFGGVRLDGGLSLTGSQVQGIKGEGLRAWGDIELSGGFRAAAEVLLLDARIEGVFQCGGGHFGASEGDALSFDRADISGSVFLNDSFEATGKVRLLGATIGGNLDSSGAKLEPTAGDALSFDRAKISGSVVLNGSFEAMGEVRFLGAMIGGNLDCSGAKLEPTAGDALSFDGAKISGSVFLKDNFEAMGKVRFLGATIGGSLTCSGAKLSPTEGDALSFDGAKISGDVSLNGSFEAMGEVRFLGATIGGNLTCGGAQFTPKEGRALSFDGAKISGSVFLNDSFQATGTVRFLGAEVGGDISCGTAQFKSEEEYALSFERAKIGGSVYLRDGFSAQGNVGLVSAEIGAWLDLSDATITGEIDANHAIIQHTFKLTSRRRELSNVEAQPILSRANLRHMQCGSLQDDATSWGTGNHLNGFTYRTLDHAAPTEPRFRVKWLQDQSPDNGTYRPQPWRHLQKTLKAMGHDAEAREIGIAHQEERRHRGVIGAAPENAGCAARLYARVARAFHDGYGVFTDYGYKPLKLLAWMAGVWLICAFIFWRAALGGIMGPTSPLVFQNEEKYKTCSYWGDPDKDPRKPTLFFVRKAHNWYFCRELPSDYTTFSPIMYSLDLLLPVVDLYQDKDWGVQIPTPMDDVIEELVSAPWQYLVRFVVWLEILFGWMASLMLVAVISGMARNTRDDE